MQLRSRWKRVFSFFQIRMKAFWPSAGLTSVNPLVTDSSEGYSGFGFSPGLAVGLVS